MTIALIKWQCLLLITYIMIKFLPNYQILNTVIEVIEALKTLLRKIIKEIFEI